jgi:predicted DNA-binding transcriptional regulator YafY
MVIEHDTRIGEQTNRLQQVVDHQRLRDIQFEIARSATHTNRHIISYHLCHYHQHGFCLRWVDLTGHNRTARFIRR